MRDGSAATAAKTSHLLVRDFDPGIRTSPANGEVRCGAFHKSITMYSLTAGTLVSMCGRYALATDVKVVAANYNVSQATLRNGALADLSATIEPIVQLSSGAVAPSYNIAPTHNLESIVQVDGKNTLTYFSWGLVPKWAKDAAVGVRSINARVETVIEKPTFREAITKRRCVIPADGWFEWQVLGPRTKQPYYFSAQDGSLLNFAGIYESWKNPDGSIWWSCAVLTTDAWSEINEIHDRMPLLLHPDLVNQWIAPGVPPIAEVLEKSSAASRIAHWPVSTAVGNVRNNNPLLVEPIDLQGNTFQTSLV